MISNEEIYNFLTGLSNVEKVEKFNDTVYQAVHCSKWLLYSSRNRTFFQYQSTIKDISSRILDSEKLLEVSYEVNYERKTSLKRTIDILLDMPSTPEKSKLYPLIKPEKLLYIYLGRYTKMYVFQHPTLKTWMLLTNWSCTNECNSCDGKTHSTVTLYEEYNLGLLLSLYLEKCEKDSLNFDILFGEDDYFVE